MLESTQHETAWFVTLTYDKEHYPVDGSLDRWAISDFVKRLRSASGDKIRYFGVGEYGDTTERPHYHLMIYGLRDHGMIKKCWSGGFVHVGFATAQSCMYIASYVLKKMTRKEDERLKGRYPEYSRMSLRKGIGYGAVEAIARALTSRGGAKSVQARGDVPETVRTMQERWPLGRYLRNEVRLALGMEKGQPEGVRRIELEVLRDLNLGILAKKVSSNRSYKRKGTL